VAIIYADGSVTSGGAGTEGDPYPFSTVFAAGSGGGDLVYLRGTYSGGPLDLARDGASGNLLLYRPWPGEGGAIIERNSWGPVLTISGDYVDFGWATRADRIDVRAAPTGTQRQTGGGACLAMTGSNLHVRGLFLHEGLNGIQSFAAALNHTIDDCIIWNIFVDEASHVNSGYPIYIQSDEPGSKLVRRCVFMGPHPGGSAHMIHGYTTSTEVDEIIFEDCFGLYQNGTLIMGEDDGGSVTGIEFRRIFWFGRTFGYVYDSGTTGNEVSTTDSIFISTEPGPGVHTVGVVGQFTDHTFTGNQVYGPDRMFGRGASMTVPPGAMDNNDYYSDGSDPFVFDNQNDTMTFAQWQAWTGKEASSTINLSTKLPDQWVVADSGADWMIVVRTNYVANATSGTIPHSILDDLLADGDGFTVHNLQDPLGATITNGTYGAAGIPVTFLNNQVDAPTGASLVATAPALPQGVRAFLVARTELSGGGPDPDPEDLAHTITLHGRLSLIGTALGDPLTA
jgi:hypothetical protein